MLYQWNYWWVHIFTYDDIITIYHKLCKDHLLYLKCWCFNIYECVFSDIYSFNCKKLYIQLQYSLILSSSFSGEPKGAMLSHENVVADAASFVKSFEVLCITMVARGSLLVLSVVLVHFSFNNAKSIHIYSRVPSHHFPLMC